MNCTIHPNEPAVAICTHCGKALCAQCADGKAEPLCPACNLRRRRVAIVSSAAYLVFYALLFLAGYCLNFFATENNPDQRALSGYMLMAVVSGWQFINGIVRWRLTQASIAGWCIYGAVKLLAAAAAGIFTAPVTVIWNIVKIIRNIIR